MNDTAKYLVHATLAADGVVERSDVVGAVFGQTEGLLGDELDLRDLQESSKVGRIDVAVESENGQSFGEVTVASSLDKVETAILAASLETIDRIGPCHASVEVTSIEDVRAAKRREIVERAKELLADGFEETTLASDEILEEVRDAARVEGIVDYEGLPAGPRVGDSDAVIVVEGRADVLTLLECGIKNAVAVEGTNVPDAVAELTAERTVTAFLDGDRGGELILRELAQVGDVDYVAFAPAGDSVEDLDRGRVFEALRGKVPYSALADEPNLREAADGATGATTADTSATGATSAETNGTAPPSDGRLETEDDEGSVDDADTDEAADAESDTVESPESKPGDIEPESSADAAEAESSADAVRSVADEADADEADATDKPRSLTEHVQEVIDAGTGQVRLLDADGGVLAESDAADAFDLVESADDSPHTVVVDGEISQRLLDVAAQRGVTDLLGRSTGEFVKQPVGTRVRTAGDLRVEA
ncbi:DNA primase DnaG [Halorubrum gandharaense]